MDFRMISWFGAGEREVTGHLRRGTFDVFYYRQSKHDIDANSQPLSEDQILANGGLLVEFEGRRIRYTKFNGKKGSAPQEALLVPVIGNERFIDLNSSATLGQGDYLILPVGSSSLDLLKKFAESCSGLSPDQRQNVLHALRQPGFEARLRRVETILQDDGDSAKSSRQGPLRHLEWWHLFAASIITLVVGVLAGMNLPRLLAPVSSTQTQRPSEASPAPKHGADDSQKPPPQKAAYGPATPQEREAIAELLSAMKLAERWRANLPSQLSVWQSPRYDVRDTDIPLLIQHINEVETAWAKTQPKDVRKALVARWCFLGINPACDIKKTLQGTFEELVAGDKAHIEQNIVSRLAELTRFVENPPPPKPSAPAGEALPPNH